MRDCAVFSYLSNHIKPALVHFKLRTLNRVSGVVIVAQLLIFYADSCPLGDRFCNERIASHNDILAHNSLTARNRRSRIYGNRFASDNRSLEIKKEARSR